MNIIEMRKANKERLKALREKTAPSSKSDYKDERFWKLDYNKATKVGKAVIRPIGPAKDEADEYVAVYSHFLKRNGKVFAFKCPSTVGNKCPVCEEYFSTPKEERDTSFSRKTKYVMNVLIKNDLQHPENNGKVFLWECPVSIFNKITASLSDTDEMGDSKTAINVFDMWEGADITIITKDQGGYLNYDSSKVSESKTPIFEDTENIELYEKLYSKLYKLSEFKTAMDPLEVKQKYSEFMNNIDTSSKKLENHIKKEIKSEQADIFNESPSLDISTNDIEDDEDIFSGLN